VVLQRRQLRLDRADHHHGQVTTYPATAARSPGSIAAGPGGAMWFGMGTGHIGRITTP